MILQTDEIGVNFTMHLFTLHHQVNSVCHKSTESKECGKDTQRIKQYVMVCMGISAAVNQTENKTESV